MVKFSANDASELSKSPVNTFPGGCWCCVTASVVWYWCGPVPIIALPDWFDDDAAPAGINTSPNASNPCLVRIRMCHVWPRWGIVQSRSVIGAPAWLCFRYVFYRVQFNKFISCVWYRAETRKWWLRLAKYQNVKITHKRIRLIGGGTVDWRDRAIGCGYDDLTELGDMVVEIRKIRNINKKKC